MFVGFLWEMHLQREIVNDLIHEHENVGSAVAMDDTPDSMISGHTGVPFRSPVTTAACFVVPRQTSFNLAVTLIDMIGRGDSTARVHPLQPEKQDRSENLSEEMIASNSEWKMRLEAEHLLLR